MARLFLLVLTLVAVAAAIPPNLSGDSRNGDSVKISDLKPRYSPDTENQYHLFTRANPTLSQVLVENNEGLLQASNYDSSKRTVVLIHGNRGSAISDFNTVLVPAFLEADDANVIVVDWSAGSEWGLNGIESATVVARVLGWLVSVTDSNLANFHIVGHGPGAHQAGLIGRAFSGEIGYITGLDPAFGWFYPNILSASDAVYTEVIHTNAGESGVEHPHGDVDFYPNGGVEQPGCPDSIFCSNDRSFFFLAESLTSGGFIGWECSSYQQALNNNCAGERQLEMGGLLPKTGSEGIFYLETNSAPPFAQGSEE